MASGPTNFRKVSETQIRDIVSEAREVVWYKNRGEARVWRKTVLIDVPGTNDHLIQVADMDGDGDLDIVRGVDELQLYSNDGNNGFGAPRVLSDRDTDALTVVDLDGDGDQDILLGTYRNDDHFATVAKAAAVTPTWA